MRKRLIPLILLFTLACQVLTSPNPVEPTTEVRTTESVPVQPIATPSPQPTPKPSATPTLTLPRLDPTDPGSEPSFEVWLHPEGPLYVGDQVSFEVIAPEDFPLDDVEVRVSLEQGSPLGTARFGGFGIAGRQQATLRWVWDTGGLVPGHYDLYFDLPPSGVSFTRTVTLLPTAEMGFPESQASWARTESDCCLFYYVTGTAAARDLDQLIAIAEEEAESTRAQFNGDFAEPLEIVFLPRVLGHGGFASGEIYISYLDRNYAGNDPAQVLHHEMAHILDSRAGGEYRPTIFVEGLAVYLSGGHFKPEPLVSRAASLIDSQLYIPLEDLLEDFYFAQHEISYLQAGALIDYLVTTWDYETFDTFYRSLELREGEGTLEALERGLNEAFGIDFQELEAGYLAYLDAEPTDPAAGADVRLSVAFFDTVRRYQQALDPSAYFLTAWLVDVNEMLDQGGIVADVVRHPETPENIVLETLLVAADRALRGGDFGTTERMLTSVNRVLEGVESGDPRAFYRDPIAQDHYALVLTSLEGGVRPQTVEVAGDTALVVGLGDSERLLTLEFQREPEGWVYR